MLSRDRPSAVTSPLSRGESDCFQRMLYGGFSLVPIAQRIMKAPLTCVAAIVLRRHSLASVAARIAHC